jgi:YfiH family protein
LRQVKQAGLTYYQFEYLAAQKKVVHGVFTRQGGVSVPPWNSLNLSCSTGDSAECVAENNRRLLSTLGLSPGQTVSAWLNHGRRVARVDSRQMGTALRDTDGLVTATPGVVLSMRFADCVPVLFHDAARDVIAIAHAGWPGIVAGVLGATVRALRAEFDCHPNDVWAGIGPAIRVECYQFGHGLAQQIVDACPPGAQVLSRYPDRTWHLDLIAAVKSQLAAAGVTQIEDSGICTACHTGEWFSHRVEKKTGRFGVVIGLRSPV